MSRPRFALPLRRLDLLLAGVLILPQLLAACGDSATTVFRSEWSLLAREPDQLLEEPGILTPDPDRQWGRQGGEGWMKRTEFDEAGTPFVYMNDTRASLALSTPGPGERELRVRASLNAFGVPPDRQTGIEMRLNDTPIGAPRLGASWTTIRLTPPAELWRSGGNTLEIVIPRSEFRNDPQGRLVGLAVAKVACGGSAPRIERDPTKGLLVLPSKTGITHLVEERGASALEIAGECEGEGELEVRLDFVDPLAGVVTGPAADPVRIRAVQGRVEKTLVLPAAEDHVLGIALFWTGSGAAPAPLRLDRLAIREASDAPRPPIIFLSFDTLGAMHTSLYGYDRRTTPRLDAFAAESVVFDRCAANAPWTSPSYAALFTGMYASSATMHEGSAPSRFMPQVAAGRWTLAESLRAVGYRTAGFIDVFHIGARFGYGQGFELFDESAAKNSIRDPAGGFRYIAPRALEWIDALEEDQPFFCFLHAFDVHGPYVPDKRFAGTFAADERSASEHMLEGGALSDTFDTIPRSIAESFYPEGDIPPRLPAAPFIAAYDEEILATDAAFGEFLDELDARGILDRAIVVVTADHGELTDQHRYFGHGLLYEENLQVPLLVHLPPSMRSARGTRVAPSVQLVDLYPTLIELAGIAARRKELHGRSLVPFLRGEELPPTLTFSEGGIMTQASVEMDGWKLIEMQPGNRSLPWTMLSHPAMPQEWLRENVPEVGDAVLTEALLRTISKNRADPAAFIQSLRDQFPAPIRELYDLRSDPRERKNVAARNPEKLAQMLRLLESARAMRDRSHRLVEEARIRLDDEEFEDLRDIGYGGGK